ncbi:SGNH/GDSL hydrolase family protein [Kineococcus esterisolvens]|uniref:SGNH/GDSL hydrolase family protein n=1 Tax=unclassified Kineococcus TaxID=2621656 RepID=UPI003D7D3855
MVPVGTYRYVALGDSFTEGMVDERPGGGYRGWADRLAEHLAAAGEEDGTVVEYANLAVRGRLLPRIVAEQVPRALDLRPDLVSLVGGGNDLLRPRADPDALAQVLDDAVRRLRAGGAAVLLATSTDPAAAPLLRRTRGAVGVLNAHVWSIAQRHGCAVLDLWGLRAVADRRCWGEDRIHMTAEGHRRAALAALDALGRPVPAGLSAAERDYRTPLPVAVPVPRREALAADLRWSRVHLLPWVRRRLRRTSSGAERTGKLPEPVPVLRPGAAARGGQGVRAAAPPAR